MLMKIQATFGHPLLLLQGLALYTDVLLLPMYHLSLLMLLTYTMLLLPKRVLSLVSLSCCALPHLWQGQAM